MKRKTLFMLSIAVFVFFLVGCTKKEVDSNNKKILTEDKKDTFVSVIFGQIFIDIPNNFYYYPDLGNPELGDNEKIYVKGNYEQKKEAIFINLNKREISESLDVYVGKLNESLVDTKYEKFKDDPLLYGREKYKSESEEVSIYNYTYLAFYGGNLYEINVSGPESKANELNDITKSIKNSIIVISE